MPEETLDVMCCYRPHLTLLSVSWPPWLLVFGFKGDSNFRFEVADSVDPRGIVERDGTIIGSLTNPDYLFSRTGLPADKRSIRRLQDYSRTRPISQNPEAH